MPDPTTWRVFDSAPADYGDLEGAKSTPTAGGRVDTVSANACRYAAAPGRVFFIEAGESLAAGQNLATDSGGHAVAAGSGDEVVAVALSGASAGSGVWVVHV